MQDYKDLIVWQKSHQLTLQVYEITKTFPREELYGLTNQMRRSCSSIPANISEGCGKFTSADFANYLQVALGSSNETEYHLLLAKDLKYLADDKHIELNKTINEIKAMLIGLIKKVRTKVEVSNA